MQTQAALIRSIGARFETATVELDDPIDREVLVEVKASSLCHSDYGSSRDDWGSPLPWIGGHELSGRVLRIGPAVVDLEVGDHVVGCLIPFCGVCAACVDGRTYQCRNGGATQRASGMRQRITENGAAIGQFAGLAGFAGLVLAHENQLVRIDGDIPYTSSCLLGCGVLTGAGSVLNAARISPGTSVLVVGAGGVGLNAVQAARIAGAARIIVADRVPGRLELATELGATDTIDASLLDTASAVDELVAGGVDCAFEFVGSPVTTRAAIQATRVGGSVYLIGIHRLTEPDEVFVTRDLIMAQRSLHGVFMGASDGKTFIPEMADRYLRGDLELDRLGSARIGIDDVADAYDRVLAGEIVRAVITDFS